MYCDFDIKNGSNNGFKTVQNPSVSQNYIEWKQNLDIVLTADEYMFVFNTLQPPVPTANAAAVVWDAHKQWHNTNEMAKGYMLASMSTMFKHQHSAIATATVIM